MQNVEFSQIQHVTGSYSFALHVSMHTCNFNILTMAALQNAVDLGY